MRRHGLILDFTSFLDVILILLFLVVAGMSGAALSAGEASEQALLAAEARLAEVEAEREALAAELAALSARAEDYEALAAELSALSERYAALQEEYDYLRITTDYDAEDISVYRAAIERMTKVALICETGRDEATGHPAVTVDVYRDSGQSGEGSYVDSITLLHDFSLSAEERARFRAEQVVEAARVLSRAIRDQEQPMVWFTIQYAYDDPNFSNQDLVILEEAISNLEHSFPVSCYAERIKLY